MQYSFYHVQPTCTLSGQHAGFLMLQQVVYMLTTLPYKVNILGPVYFDICLATGSRFMLLEFVRMSDAVHRDAGMRL